MNGAWDHAEPPFYGNPKAIMLNPTKNYVNIHLIV